MHHKNFSPSQQGYAVLSVVLVLGVLITLLGMSTTGTSINLLQSTLAGAQGSFSKNFLQGCADLALLELNTSASLPTSVITPSGTCVVTLNSQVGSSWDFTVSGEFKTHTQAVRIVAERTSTVSITSWQDATP